MAFKGWEKVKIKNDSGEIADAIAPVIISASRSTDIPAFYAQWFMDHLQKGYVQWTNPFNGKIQNISFEKTRLIVFWSKNPSPIIPFLKNLDKKDIKYLFFVTLNDYEKEKLELYVPPLSERIKCFKQLSALIGKEKVFWRFDPVILTDSITPEIILKRIELIGNEINQYTTRLTFSFLSRYTKVCRNLNKSGIVLRDINKESVSQIGKGLQELSARWGIKVVSCAENADLSFYNIYNGSCIDPEVVAENFGNDPEIASFLGLSVSNDLFDRTYHFKGGLKDKGQRELCGCIVSKDIGMYDTCVNGCIYCYANSSLKKAENNYRRIISYQNRAEIPAITCYPEKNVS